MARCRGPRFTGTAPSGNPVRPSPTSGPTAPGPLSESLAPAGEKSAPCASRGLDLESARAP